MLAKLFNALLHEPAAVVAVVIAALTSATDQSWRGYAAAVLAGLLRFVVSPVAAKP